MTTIKQETLPRCDGCDTTELDLNNHCDFCYIFWCDTCKPDYTRFHKCDAMNLPRCDGCDTIEFNSDNHCDFCDVSWCDTCKPEYTSFHKCDTCNIKWCYYNGRDADYRCIKINKSCSGSCHDCGL